MRLLKLLTLWPWFTIASREKGEPPDVPGIELTRLSTSLHFAIDNKKPHFTVPANDMHYSTEEN